MSYSILSMFFFPINNCNKVNKVNLSLALYFFQQMKLDFFLNFNNQLQEQAFWLNQSKITFLTYLLPNAIQSGLK